MEAEEEEKEEEEEQRAAVSYGGNSETSRAELQKHLNLLKLHYTPHIIDPELGKTLLPFHACLHRLPERLSAGAIPVPEPEPGPTPAVGW